MFSAISVRRCCACSANVRRVENRPSQTNHRSLFTALCAFLSIDRPLAPLRACAPDCIAINPASKHSCRIARVTESAARPFCVEIQFDVPITPCPIYRSALTEISRPCPCYGFALASKLKYAVKCSSVAREFHMPASINVGATLHWQRRRITDMNIRKICCLACVRPESHTTMQILPFETVYHKAWTFRSIQIEFGGTICDFNLDVRPGLCL
jgi:hypothetical protein